MAVTPELLLKSHKLRYTDCRLKVLDFFIEKKQALSHADLEKEFNDLFDRVTLYRTIKSFLENGLLHKVLNDEGVSKYALCNTQCPQQEHQHNHVHFKCSDCGVINCLENIKIPFISLPQGYVSKEMNVLIQGTCQLCSK